MVVGLLLALGSSFAHAAWNTVAKRVSGTGLPALWAYSATALVFVAPATVLVGVVAGPGGTGPYVSLEVVALASGSTLLHTAYAGLVQQAYRYFDVSQVYPVSRGLAPVLVASVGLVALRQQLAAAEWAGVLLVAMAVTAMLADVPAGDRGTAGTPVLWSGAIAVTIAAYTLFDGWAISVRHLDPLPYYAIGSALQVALITVLVRRRLDVATAQLRQLAGPVTLLAALVPASYLLGLYAVQRAPVSLVVAVRSTSVIWAALVAGAVLHERISRLRAIATSLVIGGLMAMVLR